MERIHGDIVCDVDSKYGQQRADIGQLTSHQPGGQQRMHSAAQGLLNLYQKREILKLMEHSVICAHILRGLLHLTLQNHARKPQSN